MSTRAARQPVPRGPSGEKLGEKLGGILDKTAAQSAAQTVIEFLKQRLPGPIAGQLDSALSGGSIQGAKELGNI